MDKKIFRGTNFGFVKKTILGLVFLVLPALSFGFYIPDIKSQIVYQVKNNTIGMGLGIELCEKEKIISNFFLAQNILGLELGYLVIPIIEGEIGGFLAYDVHDRDNEAGLYFSWIKF
ncbi:MAG: hypothetical protein ACOYWZ_08785 [Bacillota bacterium]